MDNQLLEMKGIVKTFPGVRALDNVDFGLHAGEVHALLGINGAGKSTLIKILSGIYQKDAGRIFLNGSEVVINSPHDARACGIATVYQDPQMIPSFMGYENIFLGAESEGRGLFPRIRRRQLRQRAQALLDRFPVDVDLNKPVYLLETVEKESIAILRALALENTSILILDEPTSILTRREIEVLFKQIRMLRERGIAIIYITHRLDEVFEIADRFTVFRDGQKIATHGVREAGIDYNRVTELILGKKLSRMFPGKSGRVGQDVLEVKALSLPGHYEAIDLTVRKGEILGVFGLVGSGFDALCKTIYGVLQPAAGALTKEGKAIQLKNPADAIRAGIFLVPGDRRHEGQISDESIAFNTTLSNLGHVSNALGLIRGGQERRDTEKAIGALDIKTPGPNEKVALLSGGNQQKVVISKGLYTDSDLYIFEEPTVGVDVGAKSGIYALIRDLSREKGVIVASSDSEEVYGICDRVVVLYKGRIVLNKPVDQVTREEMLLYGLKGDAQNA